MSNCHATPDCGKHHRKHRAHAHQKRSQVIVCPQSNCVTVTTKKCHAKAHARRPVHHRRFGCNCGCDSSWW